MGQKVNPIGFRLPVTRDWRSKWYASKKELSEFLFVDHKIRTHLENKLKTAALSKVLIERAWNTVRITIFTARPGVVIGRKGSEIENMTNEIANIAGGKQVKIDIVEIKKPEIDAKLVAENVASQLSRRISFRRAMKRSVQTGMDMGAEGIKVRISGRLGGSEIARTEWYREGTIPLHTLRQPIDYGFAEADTTAGKIGVKCWVVKPAEKEEEKPTPPPAPPAPAPTDEVTVVS